MGASPPMRARHRVESGWRSGELPAFFGSSLTARAAAWSTAHAASAAAHGTNGGLVIIQLCARLIPPIISLTCGLVEQVRACCNEPVRHRLQAQVQEILRDPEDRLAGSMNLIPQIESYPLLKSPLPNEKGQSVRGFHNPV